MEQASGARIWSNMKLYLLQLGSLQPVGRPVPGYVIQTDDGKNVLIDTGLPASFITHPPGPMGPLGSRPEVREEDYIVARLASIGLEPDDIDILVCTHFDLDHAGNHALFGGAELVVQRAHYEAARAGNPRLQRARPEWDAPHLHYRPIDGDMELLPGIELIESSGHVIGHQSVLVRLPHTGPVLLAIDALPSAVLDGTDIMDADNRAFLAMDEDETLSRQSTRKLADLARREGVRLIVFGHDEKQWPTLRHAPEFYD